MQILVFYMQIKKHPTRTKGGYHCNEVAISLVQSTNITIPLVIQSSIAT